MNGMALLQEFLHEMDRYPMRGLPEAMAHSQKRERYAFMTRRVEAWSSAVRDGVEISREEALAMLEEDRPAEHEAGQAVWQRYRLMEAIEENAREKTTPDDLQRYAGLVNLQIPAGVLDAIVQLINGDVPGHFIHPFLRAFTVFDEVNQLDVKEPEAAALFRALFYRVMLHHDYPVFRFLALSAQENCFVRQPPPSCEAEGVERILMFVRGINDAKLAAKKMVAQDEARYELPADMAAQARAYNHRQRMVLARALADPRATFTMENHRLEHGVAYATARADLYELRDAGLLRARKQGKAWVFASSSTPAREEPERPVIIPPNKKPSPVVPVKEGPGRTWYFW